ncbi:MAG: dTDP-4-dehydrorhamnose reductase [Gammaproteobacteria bacterium]|nr:dTDP-4-dehydrorhamnose reductase [Gammaproteobacteria bacterium]
MTTYLPSILITGAHGQLGNALQHHIQAKNYHLIACSHEQVDITQPATIEQAIATFKPKFIINAAAFTAVDQAENKREIAFQVNHLGAKNLALLCHQHQLPLIHISTAYIFDGQKKNPYVETDAAHPINAYGESKYLGEEAIKQYCEDAIILRITSVFSEYGHNFLKTILKLALEKEEFSIVADQITSPTYAGDIASALFSMMNTFQAGTYHYCNDQPVSWYEFALAIIHEAREHHALRVQNVIATTTKEYKTSAQRPANSVLDCHKINKDFGILQTNWQAALKKIVKPLLGINA